MKTVQTVARHFPFQLFAMSVTYCAFLMFRLGQFPGANYDSYQYVYAVLLGPRLTPAGAAEFARLHVHSGYFPVWQLLKRCGLPTWEAATWLNILCTAGTVVVIYALAKRQGSSHRFALVSALLFQSFSTVAFYSNIPEVYAPWVLCLSITLLCLEQQKEWWAVGWFSLAAWLFLATFLLLPAFLWVKGRRKWLLASLGFSGGILLHLLTMRAYGVPFLSRLASERVYWQVATGWNWYFTSTWESLAKSGMAWVTLWALALTWVLRRRLGSANLRLLLLALPLLVAPSLWVKDHGSFFLPFGLLVSLLCPMLTRQWTGGGRWRSSAALASLLVLVALNLQSSWQVVSYDRKMGQSQVEYCQHALKELPQNSRVISTALLSTWLWAKEAAGRGDVECCYFPWLLRSDYLSNIETSLANLKNAPGTYFVDLTVTPLVADSGKVLSTIKITVPYWPKGQVYWDLKAVYLGLSQP